MTNAELGTQIESAWRSAVPITAESAKQIADGILADHPRQQSEFGKWFEVYGQLVIDRFNNG